ncbi:MAG: protein-tyrosine phosphatase [Alcanivorax sp.]|jgi:protein-tyrosine phosphatase
MATDASPVRVLFVCLGNICRSPTAHGIFEAMVNRAGFQARIKVDSCGTGGWHVGMSPDARATAEAAQRGYDIAHLRARQLRSSDFLEFDYIIAMDRANLNDLRHEQPENSKARLVLFLDYGSANDYDEVPDPYYGGIDGFAQVLDLVEDASTGLLRTLVNED